MTDRSAVDRAFMRQALDYGARAGSGGLPQVVQRLENVIALDDPVKLIGALHHDGQRRPHVTG